jgi:hypothetical protein
MATINKTKEIKYLILRISFVSCYKTRKPELTTLSYVTPNAFLRDFFVLVNKKIGIILFKLYWFGPSLKFDPSFFYV